MFYANLKDSDQLNTDIECKHLHGRHSDHLDRK